LLEYHIKYKLEYDCSVIFISLPVDGQGKLSILRYKVLLRMQKGKEGLMLRKLIIGIIGVMLVLLLLFIFIGN